LIGIEFFAVKKESLFFKIKNLPRSLFLLSQRLFNADIWQNFTLEEVNLRKQKINKQKKFSPKS